MHGLMENAIYGGRVDNTFDMRVLTSYLVQYFSDSVVTGHVRSDLSCQSMWAKLLTHTRMYIYIHVEVDFY